MVLFPNCKINLGLNIIRKREDGYHDLETALYPLPLKDAVEVIKPSSLNNQSSVQLSCSGLNVEGKNEENLCIKAWDLLKKHYPHLPSVQMHLHKMIPLGAGLGGGSSDGAFILKLVNQKFQLNLTQEQLINYALQLGSDCPFFIINKPCLATGRGEILNLINLDLSNYVFAIINPGIHINTQWAYSKIKPVQPSTSLRDIIQQPVSSWKNKLMNQFEFAIAAEYPVIQDVKNELYKKGASYASMTGSGSTVYGIFERFPPPFNFDSSWIRIVDGNN